MGNRGLAMTTTRMTLTELNALDQDECAAKLASLFEGTSWVAAQTWPARPFSSLAHLHPILSSVMFDAPHERQVEIALGEIARICWLRLLNGVNMEEHAQRSHGNGLSRG
jgi:2-oxo-4-hydroxy-4-carboxy--5-ureidoimidazoline (OHCU) decarboxylase